MQTTLKNKPNLVHVERLKRGKMVYYKQSIITNGIDFITVKGEDKDGSFEHTFNKSMCKEFFRKLKATNNV